MVERGLSESGIITAIKFRYVRATMQNELNKIFKVKPKTENSGLLVMIRDRFLTFVQLVNFSF